ncbi:hypothetical protein CAEBREN_17346 [Caenorhabditis brenneri]|uniref:3-oxo-5-alpha-steroid 4-dehydrogenase C-terminal domain-containing protein n=1 Tax=Caenorhabditis brenneri TaxID=135651 RepID=G0MWJ6_CAEBE|nr:hypothetical protein CAEBREN_17346 [Caenorhabditis brenneri]
MYTQPPTLGDFLTWDTLYLLGYHFHAMLGFAYMYLAWKDRMSPKAVPNFIKNDNSLFLVDAFVIENSVFLIAFIFACIFGKSEMGRFGSVLLLSDMIVTFAFIPTGTVYSHHCVLIQDVALRLIRNTIIALYLSTYNCMMVQDVWLGKMDIFNVIVGLGLFFFGLKKKMENHKVTSEFPFNLDPRIMGASAFEYCTSPDFFGELLQWIGYHVVCGSTVSMGFALYKCQVAMGNAYMRHVYAKRRR